MTAAYVQHWDNVSGSPSTVALTVTVSGATANNTLVGVITVQDDATFSITGWTIRHQDKGLLQGAAFATRLASGTSADDFAATWDESGRVAAMVQEFSGLDTSSPFEDSDYAESLATNVSSIGTGTATPVNADGIAVAGLGIRARSSWASADDGTGISINNSFTDTEYRANDAGHPLVGMASLAYSSAAAKTATWTGNGGTTTAFGAVAVFKEPAAGGGTRPQGPFGHVFMGPFGGPI